MDNLQPRRGRPPMTAKVSEETQQEPVESGETIVVGKEVLADLIRQVELLTKIANKDKLARVSPQKEFGREVSIGLYQGKVITSFKMIKDEVNYTQKDEKENQIIRLELEDGSHIDLSYKVFRQTIDKVKVQLKMRPQDFEEKHVRVDTGENKTEMKTYRTLKACCFDYNGKEYVIDSQFVNP